jgi:hypothetical protein
VTVDKLKPKRKTLLQSVHLMVKEINEDRYMLMEYLVPTIDGSRAALKVSLEQARAVHKISDSEFEEYLDSTDPSLHDVTICFTATDVNEQCSIVFEGGHAKAYEECIEPDVHISGDEATLTTLLDSDSKASPVEDLGEKYFVEGVEPSTILEGLGFMCFAPLLRTARTGVDPSSLLSEDADSIILASASDLVVKIIKKWLDLQLTQ